MAPTQETHLQGGSEPGALDRHRGQWYNLQAGSKGSGKEGLREEKRREEEEDRRGEKRV